VTTADGALFRSTAGSVALLLLGGALVAVSAGRWFLPIAAWVGPALILAFARAHPPAVGAGLVTMVLVLCFGLSWRGLIPVHGLEFVAIAVGFGVAQSLPYCADRLLTPSLPPPAASLVFPAALVTTELVVARLSPYGSWGASAYTQSSLPLLQLGSVAGTAGLAFLMGWFASAAAGVLLRPGMATAGVLGTAIAATALVWAWGTVRLSRHDVTPSIRVAMIARDWGEESRAWRLLNPKMSERELARIRPAMEAASDSLFGATRRAAAEGARAVAWSELAMLVAQQDLPSFLARARAVARRDTVQLFVTAGVFTPGARTMENVLFAIRPDGRLVAYHKGRPVPGDPESGSDRRPATVDMPLGQTALAICFDLDFPSYVRSRSGRPVWLVAPARDWPEVAELHSRMAVHRSIENGVALVRPTARGTSVATDARGRERARASTLGRSAHVALADVPATLVETLYTRFGDWLGWLCAAGVLVLSALSWRGLVPPPRS